jgi:hypothetical protein
MNIIQRFIPASNTKTRPGIKMTPKYITIHETDNTAPRANAEAHARLQESGNDRTASWHLTVDDQYAIQSIPFDEVAWHAGDGRGPGNMTSIALEICVNSDGDYKKAVANAAEVTRQLMQQFNIPVSNVVQHNHWSGKNCPYIMRSGKAGVTWNDFLNLLKVPAPAAKNGWVKDNNIWYFYKNGQLVKNDWVKHTDGKWYYLKADGKMAAAEWVRWKEKWYYLKADGSMATGVVEDKGKLYYLNNDGSMIADTKVNVTLKADKSGALRP